MVACAHEKPKSGELWLIDNVDSSLYRTLNNGEEEYMPILENPDTNRFVCMDTMYFKNVCPKSALDLKNLLEAVPVRKLLGD